MPFLDTVVTLLPNVLDSSVYVMIGLIFATGLLRCVLPVMRTGTLVKKGTKKLIKKAPSGSNGADWQNPLFLGKKLQSHWHRFLLNSEQLTYRGLSHNVDDYINDDTVVYRPGSGPFAELIPGLLTSLGILGTFIGLMSGMEKLDFADTAALIDAIPTLLSGMQYAFATSIAGITCSIVFNILYRIASGRAFKALDAFCDVFSQVALRRAPEDSVQMLCQNQDRYMVLTGLSNDVSAQVAVSVEGAIARSMSPVTASMDRFINAATREQLDGINRIVTQFINKMNTALNGQFLELGQTMTALNQNQAASNEMLKDTLSAASGLTDNLSVLHGSMNEIIERFETYLAKLTAYRDDTAMFETESVELLRKMNQTQQQQTHVSTMVHEHQIKLEKHIKDYASYSETMLTGIKHLGDASAGGIESASEHFKYTASLLSESYGTFVENITEGFSRSLAMFDESIHDILRTLSGELERMTELKTRDGLIIAFSQIQQTMTAIQETLEKYIFKQAPSTRGIAAEGTGNE